MDIHYKGKKIAEILNGTLIKRIKEDKHLLRRAGGTPAIQAGVDDLLENFKDIVVVTDTGRQFKTSRENWLRHRYKIDLGHGVQYAMSKKYWFIVEPNAQELGI